MPFGDTPITVAGNLTGDPDLRYTQTGVAVAAFTVAASRRVYDQGSGQWKDGDTLFLRCSVWRELAEHAAECLLMCSSLYERACDLVMCVTDTVRHARCGTLTACPRAIFWANCRSLG